MSATEKHQLSDTENSNGTLVSPYSALDPCPCPFLGNHESVSSISKCLQVWKKELANDGDCEFILERVKHGFRIMDKGSDIKRVEGQNHRSAYQYKGQVEQELLTQIKEGNYCVASEKPTIVTPLAAIAKDDGGIRLIHDGS